MINRLPDTAAALFVIAAALVGAVIACSAWYWRASIYVRRREAQALAAEAEAELELDYDDITDAERRAAYATALIRLAIRDRHDPLYWTPANQAALRAAIDGPETAPDGPSGPGLWNGPDPGSQLAQYAPAAAQTWQQAEAASLDEHEDYLWDTGAWVERLIEGWPQPRPASQISAMAAGLGLAILASRAELAAAAARIPASLQMLELQ